MAEIKGKDFCTECRKNTEYVLTKRDIVKTIKEKEYNFCITTAVCSKCGNEMSLPGLIDQNVQEVDGQYRAAEGLVAVSDIEKLMNLYNIGKAPLSLALGFGEITITRYLMGQIPSKEYSDVMKKALSSPAYMKSRLLMYKEKIANAAYKKAFNAASNLENLFSVSEKMLKVISYIFKSLEEVTPLMLQKLLYFTQGLSYAIYGRQMFSEDCEAWVHGPVFPKVYDMFKDFKYNPIEDDRFAVIEGISDKLSKEEKQVINLVTNTFGLYGGKALEKITHNEKPWRKARKGYGENIPSNEIITKSSIKTYYKGVNEKFDIASEDGLKEYIQKMMA